MQITLPDLADGERNAGLILKEDGTPDYWLIKLPDKHVRANKADAVKLAADHGGKLPDKREGRLLMANLKEEFEPAAYWLEEDDSEPGWAWFQGFGYGTQATPTRATSCSRVPSADCPFSNLAI